MFFADQLLSKMPVTTPLSEVRMPAKDKSTFPHLATAKKVPSKVF